jgi:hypothetical protein
LSIKPQPKHRNTSVRGWKALRSILRSIIGCRHWAQTGASARMLRKYGEASVYIEGTRRAAPP